MTFLAVGLSLVLQYVHKSLGIYISFVGTQVHKILGADISRWYSRYSSTIKSGADISLVGTPFQRSLGTDIFVSKVSEPPDMKSDPCTDIFEPLVGPPVRQSLGTSISVNQGNDLSLVRFLEVGLSLESII